MKKLPQAARISGSLCGTSEQESRTAALSSAPHVHGEEEQGEEGDGEGEGELLTALCVQARAAQETFRTPTKGEMSHVTPAVTAGYSRGRLLLERNVHWNSPIFE